MNIAYVIHPIFHFRYASGIELLSLLTVTESSTWLCPSCGNGNRLWRQYRVSLEGRWKTIVVVAVGVGSNNVDLTGLGR